MSKAPMVYPKLVDDEEPAPAPAPATTIPPPVQGDKLRDVSAQVVVYMSAECHKALARYGLEESRLHAKVKVHDIILEAIQEWVDQRGLNFTARAKSKGRWPRKG